MGSRAVGDAYDAWCANACYGSPCTAEMATSGKSRDWNAIGSADLMLTRATRDRYFEYADDELFYLNEHKSSDPRT